MKLFQGDSDINHVAWGESVYGPLHDPMFIPRSNPQPDQLAQWRRIVTEIAAARLPLHVHANLTDTIDAFLDQIEAVNREHPIGDLRWTLAHLNQPNAAQLQRMKRLGLAAAVHPWAVINGGINRRVFGDAALDMAPLKTIQESGVTWGLGSDGARANQILPFTTLWWAVTGKMVGRAEGAAPADQPRGRARRAHAPQRVVRLPGEEPRIARGRQAGRSPGARPRLPDGSRRPDQGHRAGDDDGRGPDRLRSALVVSR